MLPPTAPRLPALSRRSLLVGALGTAGLALLAGCTGDDGGSPPLSTEEADALAAQVAVQEAAVSAYAAASAADPVLGDEVAPQAEQAMAQLDRLRAAAPGATSPAPPAAGGLPAGGDVRAWLREELAAAAAAHEAACAEQSAARAALLGSVAAGLRGQAAVLA